MNQVAAGITLIIIGSSLCIGGFVLLLAAERPTGRVEAPEPVAAPPILPPDSPVLAKPETAPPLSSVEKGQLFEEWVVRRFRRDLFTIKEWRGDKYVDGIYAESTHFPDLEVEFHLKDARELFAVECKWRSEWEPGAKPFLTWASDKQISNYQAFARSRSIPVFAVIGIGGRPDAPAEVFVVPLERLRYANASAEYLGRFRRKSDVSRNFFYDPQLRELR